MPIRITGMNSGLDTESIIAELVKVQKTKVDTIKKTQTKLEWKQDAWKTLNSKILKLYKGTIEKLKWSTSYSKKTTSVSDSNSVSVITGEGAVNGVHNLQVDKMAKTGYLTGAKLTSSNGEKYTGSSKLVDDLGITSGSTFSITNKGGTTEIVVDNNTTIADVVSKLKAAGVEASFDENNQRFFVNSKEMGAENDFAITASNPNGTDALDKLGILIYDDTTKAEYQKYANMATDPTAFINEETDRRLASILSKKKTLEEGIDALKERQNLIANEFSTAYGSDSDFNDVTAINKADLQQAIDDLEAITNPSEEDLHKMAVLEAKMSFVDGYASTKEAISNKEDEITSLTTNSTGDSYLNADGTASSFLVSDAETYCNNKIDEAVDAINNWSTMKGSVGATKVEAQDAKIFLNEAEFTSTSNDFKINGLTITVKSDTNKDNITLSTQDDTDGIYDLIKNFIKEYNSIINEMDKLYNSESTKGYEPLTDEERDAMSDTEADKWEQKIKDSVLRRDSTINMVSSSLKEIMLSGINVNGKTMYLSDFGISTLGYFLAPDNEKNAFHIDGDEDDSSTSNNADVLKGMIATDSETVTQFFVGLSRNLYGSLQKMFASSDYKSYNNLYDDKKWKEDYDNYTKKIAEQEKKVTAMEDKWYKKFAAMETALAKMQSNQSAVSSLLGG